MLETELYGGTNGLRLNVTLVEDLLDHVVLVAGAEFILKLAFAGGVEDTLLAVPSVTC